MTLEADEFIRRFLLHILPDGFHRIRHYGFLANGHRAEKLALCRRLLATAIAGAARRTDTRITLPPRAPERCPSCGGAMVVLAILPRPTPFHPPFWDDSS